MTKQELRKIYLEKRKRLSESEYAQCNSQLYNQFFFAIDLSFVKVLHVFLPIVDKREPDTWPIIDRIRREYPDIRVAIPRVNHETNALENFYFEGLHQLVVNPWGISEPKQGIPCEAEKIDIVLVPLLVCDMWGNRLGYGKGYYDRFLKTCRVNVRKLGISTFDPEDHIPAEDYDVKLTEVITPKGYIQFI